MSTPGIPAPSGPEDRRPRTPAHVPVRALPKQRRPILDPPWCDWPAWTDRVYSPTRKRPAMTGGGSHVRP
jgi:hypothetical protein